MVVDLDVLSGYPIVLTACLFVARENLIPFIKAGLHTATVYGRILPLPFVL